MAYNTPKTDVRTDANIRNPNYRTLWGVVYAVIALAIVLGAVWLFTRGRVTEPVTTPTTVTEPYRTDSVPAPPVENPVVPGP